ncbi:glycoside hydrolase family 108 protein [Meridianimarinicoccus sp. RP-17]|uniref:glycoside hydrolase family 108 protein n=1 Tax=Meridianimarinicoccus zhengii TaxID=2056810 RepID=UPI0013A69D53|nr:glycosyl hydrolase 108 family protein [Phycocomes zhengii]
MNPLIGLAVNLLPDLARHLTRGAKPETSDLVVSVVRDVLGTDDPEEAARRAEDAQLSAELRLKLAEIDLQARAQEAAAEEARRRDELADLSARLDADAARREAEIRELTARMGDQQNARGIFRDLAVKESAYARGPVLVSGVVTVGFFATLLALIWLMTIGKDLSTNSNLMQIINIAIGALTAGFATVVSFWLGSSDGSRRKDMNAIQTQTENAAIQREGVESTRRIVADQTRETAKLLEQVARAPQATATPPPGPQKDARQFTRCVDLIFRHEGGFVDDPADPGGATNMGITIGTLAAVRGTPVSREDVENLTRDEARQIYRAHYWNALGCDSLPPGIDLVVFDFGVNAGVSRSAKLLQKLVHVEADGEVGPITVGAARAIDPVHIVNAFSDARMDHYRSLSTWERFRNGWTRRTAEVREAALKMLPG